MTLKHLCLATLLALAAFSAAAEDKVVYQINDTQTQALAGLRSVRNQLDTEPSTQVTVVAYAMGVDFLLEDAKDRSGVAYAELVAALKSRGVKFEVCEITLQNRGLTKGQFIMEADFTPSGVVRITKLQHQGYAYLRP
jgi:intracellular sulfur oxidation DsrE/DsrF family protein